jgi:hypothetical protein
MASDHLHAEAYPVIQGKPDAHGRAEFAPRITPCPLEGRCVPNTTEENDRIERFDKGDPKANSPVSGP